jgi:type I restriction enzyme R subunit
MAYNFSEDGLVETALQECLEELGWTVLTAWKQEGFGPDGLLGRENKGEVVLRRYLLKALRSLNPDRPEVAYEEAARTLVQRSSVKQGGRINQEKYRLLKDGVPVSYTNPKGELVEEKLRVIDYHDYHANHFLSVRQLEVTGELYARRPDVIGFVNGLPLVFFELKAPNKDIADAYYDNLEDYKDTIPHLFDYNAFIILSNGTASLVGTLTSDYNYFLEWKRIAEGLEGEVSLSTVLHGTCAPARLLDLFENFLLFDDAGGTVKKLMAKNHQYLGVNRVVENVRRIEELDGRLGVYWHTQGSGKSYSMVFLCEKVHRKLGGSYTFLIVADRSELENQLYDTFSGVGVVKDESLRAGKKKGTTGREHLRELLTENHRYVFTLIHKFSVDPQTETDYPLLTERSNVIVISDEAHRTQGGTFARNMRYRALPNASFLGFTGTPIIKEEEELTRDIFGDYVSVYDFHRAIEDEATLPLKYLNRGEKLHIDNPRLDERMAEVLEREDLDEDQRQKLSYLFSKDYPVLTAEPRLRAIARDLVWHFNERGYQGKAMFVALDKPTAVRMYDYVTEYWPEYLADLRKRIKAGRSSLAVEELRQKYERVAATEICVVVSSEQNEVKKFWDLGLHIEDHRRKMVQRNLEKEFKDPENPFRLAIVCAMWITGFDAPSVSTIYLDKPIKGHTLMQTIARANRVYDDDKENGLIVDYGNVYQQLRAAYAVYGEGGRSGGAPGGNPGPVVDLSETEAELERAITEVRSYLKSLNFNLRDVLNASAMKRLAAVHAGADAVRRNETTRATFETMARLVFRKYKALFPEEGAKRHTRAFEAIEAIYKNLNQSVRSADVSAIIRELQAIVSESVDVRDRDFADEETAVDLASLDVEALQAVFAKKKGKNTVVFNLQRAIDRQLQRMLRDNPLRLEFYESYREIIERYNAGKDQAALEEVFGELTELVRALGEEEARHIREELSGEEVLAIYDLLREGKQLSDGQKREVRGIAEELLSELKERPLAVERWRESRQVTAGVRTTIYDKLLWLPPTVYTETEVTERSGAVYQYVWSRYPGVPEFDRYQ